MAEAACLALSRSAQRIPHAQVHARERGACRRTQADAETMADERVMRGCASEMGSPQRLDSSSAKGSVASAATSCQLIAKAAQTVDAARHASER